MGEGENGRRRGWEEVYSRWEEALRMREGEDGRR